MCLLWEEFILSREETIYNSKSDGPLSLSKVSH